MTIAWLNITIHLFQQHHPETRLCLILYLTFTSFHPPKSHPLPKSIGRLVLPGTFSASFQKGFPAPWVCKGLTIPIDFEDLIANRIQKITCTESVFILKSRKVWQEKTPGNFIFQPSILGAILVSRRAFFGVKVFLQPFKGHCKDDSVWNLYLNIFCRYGTSASIGILVLRLRMCFVEHHSQLYINASWYVMRTANPNATSMWYLPHLVISNN